MAGLCEGGNEPSGFLKAILNCPKTGLNLTNDTTYEATKPEDNRIGHLVSIATLPPCEVRSVIKFLNAQGIAAIEIDRQLCQVFGPNVMSKQMVRCCCRQFSAGRQNVHDEERSERPTIITDDLVEQRSI
ncbi:hypothetical protein ANN_16442 [Periplaneta americana]|uniref:Mos1 transposase HTH domain-containing protein n=1 Tax=Periplaneta americana TaxID=6978 RepID=A0ABQ8SKC4_PERAM|nr:hypothetical protein ANN_16442 [Periplaneta americana]